MDALALALYSLRRRDETVEPLVWISEGGISVIANAADISTDVYTTPREQILIIDSLAMQAVGGGASNALRIAAVIKPPTQSLITPIFHYDFPSLGTTNFVTTLRKPVMVPPQSTITVTGYYNSAATSNSITAWMTGILIPRGNFEIQ